MKRNIGGTTDLSELASLVEQLRGMGYGRKAAQREGMQMFRERANNQAGRSMNPITREIIGEVLGGGILTTGGAVLRGLGGEPGASSLAPRGKDFLFGAEAYRQAQRDYYSPYAIALRQFFDVEMPTPDQQRQKQIDAYGDLDDANRRAIEQRAAELQGLAGIAAIEGRLGVERERVGQEGAIGVQQVKSLGDVQRQRVQSGYEAASNMLQKAIENIAYVEKVAGDPVAEQLSSLPTI